MERLQDVVLGFAERHFGVTAAFVLAGALAVSGLATALPAAPAQADPTLLFVLAAALVALGVLGLVLKPLAAGWLERRQHRTVHPRRP